MFRRTPGSRGAALAVAALLLSACTGDGDATTEPTPTPNLSAPSASADPEPVRASEPPRPDARVCFALGFDDALSPTNASPQVACDGSHTSLTYAVGRVDNVVGGHLLAVDSARVQADVAEQCPRRLEAFLGGPADALALSMLRAVWFTPTVEESDAGADWVRCDVIALAGSSQLAGLGRGRLAGVLDSDQGRERFAMCGTAAPDAENFERVLCSRPHRWRAVDVVPFTPGDYPGLDAVRQAGQAPCEDAGREVAQDALDFQWGYEFPTREQWRSGQTFGRCWAPDSLTN